MFAYKEMERRYHNLHLGLNKHLSSCGAVGLEGLRDLGATGFHKC